MKKTKRILALLLAVIFVMGLFAGCGKKEENTGDEFTYVPNYVDIPFEFDGIQSSAVVGDKIYFAARVLVDTITHTETYDPAGYEDVVIEGSAFPEIVGDYPAAINTTVTEEEPAEEEKAVADENSIEAPMMPVEDEFTWEEEIFKTKIFGIDFNGENPVEFDFELEENDYESGIYRGIYGIYDGGNGNISVVVYENKDLYDLPEDFDETVDYKWDYYSGSEGVYKSRIFDKDGKFVEERELYHFSDNGNDFYPSYFVFDESGKIFMADYQTVKVVDAEGKELKKYEGLNFQSIGKVSGGKVGIICWNENGNELRVIDGETLELGEGTALPYDCYEITATSKDYPVIYNNYSGGLFGVKETGEKEKIVSWIDVDLYANNVGNFYVAEDGDIFVFTNEWDDNGNYNMDLVHFVKTPSSEVPQKEIITMAVNYLDWDTRKAVLEFNKTNQNYRIKVNDYSEYETNDDYSAGITKLNTEIIAGKVPDIIATNNIPINRYYSKGLFEDLTPYIEKSVGMENLVAPFFNALKTEDGKLYEIYANFNIGTYVGLKNIVGDRYSWTFADLKEALAKLPEGARVFENYFTKDTVLSEFVNRNLESFVNWKTGECNFESREFIELLEFANTFPLEFDWETYDYKEDGNTDDAIKNGKQLLKAVSMYDFNEWRANTFYTFGDNVGFVGMPTVEGSGSYFTLSGTGFAMSSTSKYKDVVWDFIGKILTEEYQVGDTDNLEEEEKYRYVYGYPTNKNAFDKFAKAAMTPDFDEFYDPENDMNGGRVYYGMNGKYAEEAAVEDDVVSETEDLKPAAVVYGEGQVNEKGWHEVPKTYYWSENDTVPVYSMTEKEYGILLDILENCDTVYRYNDELVMIINEEVQGYFQGQKSVEDTAKMIQSRVKLYVNEQK